MDIQLVVSRVFAAAGRRQMRQRATAPCPTSAEASHDLARTRETVLTCSRRLRDDANDADAWHTLGTALVALGDRVGAFTALRNALLLDNQRAVTHLALGKLLFDTARFDDALRCFEFATARGSRSE